MAHATHARKSSSRKRSSHRRTARRQAQVAQRCMAYLNPTAAAAPAYAAKAQALRGSSQ